MNLSDFCHKKWMILEDYPTFVTAEGYQGDFYFDAGNKIIADKIVSDHNQMLETNQRALSLIVNALDIINENKGEENQIVDNYDMLASFITLELPKFLERMKTNE